MSGVPLMAVLLAASALALAAAPPQRELRRRSRLLGIGARPGESIAIRVRFDTVVARIAEAVSGPQGTSRAGGGALVAAATCMALALGLLAVGRDGLAIPAALAGAAALATPVGAQLARARRERRAMEAELPLAVEKLAVYLASGFSLSAALTRLGEQEGAAGRAFALIGNGVRSGLSAAEAGAEAAKRWPGPAMTRLATLLEGTTGGADMVRAARSAAAGLRAEAHRGALAAMEKDSQKIWIPITIAALVPGVVMIFVPFVAVMRSVAG
ncbi:MAG: hypothetical protein M0Z47_01100 [Actinomycetota bacterium]|nr:hypothetical protein [Actinomycetota bacterium]